MFKQITNIIILLIFYPANAWKKIDETGYDNNIQKDYVLPLILIGVFTSVLGYSFNHSFEIQSIIKIIAIVFLSYYIGFFASAYLIRTFIAKMYDEEIDWKKILHFTGYSFTVVLVINMIVGLIPVDAFFLKVFNLYTVVLALHGSVVLGIAEEERSRFAIVATIIILICPFAVKSLMNLMMPGMSV